ncbi:MAG: hypothetical protein JWN24_980 [Phycisphaerales bacterium]|nr:hypothetical protein [Phycisphaerales bacterium]
MRTRSGDSSVGVPIPLEDTGGPPVPREKEDRRPRMPEPPGVRLVTVEDARLIAAAGLEPQLDSFYVGLLGFQRDLEFDGLAYRSENFRVIFDVIESPTEPPVMRPLGIEVLSLVAAEHKLIAAEIEYLRQKSIVPGQESLLLRDPAGNWIELGGMTEFR